MRLGIVGRLAARLFCTVRVALLLMTVLWDFVCGVVCCREGVDFSTSDYRLLSHSKDRVNSMKFSTARVLYAAVFKGEAYRVEVVVDFRQPFVMSSRKGASPMVSSARPMVPGVLSTMLPKVIPSFAYVRVALSPCVAMSAETSAPIGVVGG